MIRVPKDYKSYKAKVNNENKEEKDEGCWVDDNETEERSSNTNRNKNSAPMSQNQNKRSRVGVKNKGNTHGKPRESLTEEEKSNKDQVQRNRAMKHKKRGGAHDQKAKARKKYGF